MPRDQYDEKPQPPLVAQAARPGRYLLFCGVAVACVLGGGLGLWARPGLSERNPPTAAIAPVPVAPQQPHELQIVVDHQPGGALSAPVEKTAAVTPEPIAPVRPPQALVRVQAVAAPKLAAPKRMAIKIEAPPPKPRLLKAAMPAKAPPKAIRKAEHIAPKAVRTVLAKAPKPTPRPKLQIAKLAAPKAPVRLIKAAHVMPRTAREARPEPKLQKVKLARPSKASDHRAKPEKVRPAKLQKAVAGAPKPVPRKAPRIVQASRPVHAPPPAPARAVGLMKVANTSRCASSDPGAAAVCANPSLGAADRQLNRAYRDAQAAGVPGWQLQRQQQRWLAARTAAAREAPWAVHDVYQARIAELNGMTRNAQSSPGF